jgi:hypothetical protein
MPQSKRTLNFVVLVALLLCTFPACVPKTGPGASVKSDAIAKHGDDFPKVSRGSHYETGKECIKSTYAEADGKCLTFPAPAKDLEILPKRNTTFFHYIDAGPLESPLEWVDITNGILALYDYRWKNWGPCVDFVLREFGEKHGHFTTYFRTRDGMNKYKNPESDGKFGEDHDFGHSNRRSFFLQHNHISFNEKPWTKELFAEFVNELKRCELTKSVADELIKAFDKSEQAKNPASASNSCRL